MKVRQSSIVRWVAKFVAKDAQAPTVTARKVRTLDGEQLRHVSGGTGTTTQLPNKGW